MTAIQGQPPLPDGPIPLKKPSIDVYGLDAKIHKLAAEHVQPRGFFAALGLGEKYVGIQVSPQKEIYVKMSELAKVLGTQESDIASKTPQEISILIEKHNHIVHEVNTLVQSFASVHPKIEEFTSSLVKFTINQLKGRETGNEALKQLEVVAGKIETLVTAIHAGETGSLYLGKRKLEPSLLVSDGKIYLGGPRVGKGSYTKVNALQSLPTDSFVGVKAVGRGTKGVKSLEENLDMIEKLNKLGIPNITPVHRFKVYTKTKQGEPKIVALVSKLDGDGDTLVGFSVNPIHICKALSDVSDALAGMHKKKYVHSDVKPANLLVRGDIRIQPQINPQGQLETIGGVLHDFGGSGIIGKPVTTLSPAYAAPEVYRARISDQSLDLAPEQDAFSFGVVVFEMACTSITLRSGPNISRENQIFATAVSDGEILTRINEMKQMLLNRTSLVPQHQLLRIELLDIAERLLKVNPKDRMTTEQASAALKVTLDTHFEDMHAGRIDQKLKDIEDSLAI